MDFQTPTAVYFRDQIAFPFFEHYLKDGPAAELPKSGRFPNRLEPLDQENAWPPANAVKRSLYLHANEN
jgi:uncharacterized protein